MRRLIMKVQCVHALRALYVGVHMASLLGVVLASFVAQVKGVKFSGSLVLTYPLSIACIAQCV